MNGPQTKCTSMRREVQNPHSRATCHDLTSAELVLDRQHP